MDERQRRVIESLGLNAEQFEPHDTNERLDTIESAIVELAEILAGGDE